MHHTTFEKNWPCRFKEEFKNAQLLTHDDGRIPITMDHITRGKNRRTGVFLQEQEHGNMFGEALLTSEGYFTE